MVVKSISMCTNKLNPMLKAGNIYICQGNFRWSCVEHDQQFCWDLVFIYLANDKKRTWDGGRERARAHESSNVADFANFKIRSPSGLLPNVLLAFNIASPTQAKASYCPSRRTAVARHEPRGGLHSPCSWKQGSDGGNGQRAKDRKKKRHRNRERGTARKSDDTCHFVFLVLLLDQAATIWLFFCYSSA